MGTRRVKELMLSLNEYATVQAGSTLHEALVELSKSQLGLTYDRHHHRAILVLDAQGKVLGKLTHWAILRSLELSFFSEADQEMLSRSGLSPEFIRSLRLSSTPFSGSLARLCREAARIKVEQAMVPVRESIDEEATLNEAIRMMVLGHWQSMLVTHKGEVAGIIRLSDVFEDVADLIRRSPEQNEQELST